MKYSHDFQIAEMPTVSDLAPIARFSLRARESDLEHLGTALGLTLPTRVGERAEGDGREALCLGPDEWEVTADAANGPVVVAALVAVYPQAPHALTNISDRVLSYRISGPGTLSLLALGCPRDLSAIAPGQGARTVFDGASVVLRRDGPEDVTLDVWRSFAPHLRSLLDTGLAELRAGL